MNEVSFNTIRTLTIRIQHFLRRVVGGGHDGMAIRRACEPIFTFKLLKLSTYLCRVFLFYSVELVMKHIKSYNIIGIRDND